MNTCIQLAEAFTIFAKYSCLVNAEHDEILVLPDPDLSPEDLERIKELGWGAAIEGGYRKFVV